MIAIRAGRRHITAFGRLFALFVVGALLAGCAEPIPKTLVTPEYKGTTPAKLNVGMTDHRTFILSNNKEEWFEGILRGGFGIPLSLKRPGPDEGQPFAIYLSEMLADGLRADKTEVVVIPVAKGTELGAAVASVADGAAGIIFKINHSRYDSGFSAEYRHDFNVVIADADGHVVLEKTFSRFDTDVPLSQTYNIFDMYAAVYKKTLDEILGDPEVVAALSSLAAAPTS